MSEELNTWYEVQYRQMHQRREWCPTLTHFATLEEAKAARDADKQEVFAINTHATVKYRIIKVEVVEE